MYSICSLLPNTTVTPVQATNKFKLLSLENNKLVSDCFFHFHTVTAVIFFILFVTGVIIWNFKLTYHSFPPWRVQTAICYCMQSLVRVNGDVCPGGSKMMQEVHTKGEGEEAEAPYSRGPGGKIRGQRWWNMCACLLLGGLKGNFHLASHSDLASGRRLPLPVPNVEESLRGKTNGMEW